MVIKLGGSVTLQFFYRNLSPLELSKTDQFIEKFLFKWFRVYNRLYFLLIFCHGSYKICKIWPVPQLDDIFTPVPSKSHFHGYFFTEFVWINDDTNSCFQLYTNSGYLPFELLSSSEDFQGFFYRFRRIFRWIF